MLIHKMFIRRPTNALKWTWYEWLCFALCIILTLWAIVGIVYTVWCANKRNKPGIYQEKLVLEPQQEMYHYLGWCQIGMLLAGIVGILWLWIFRNHMFFLMVFIFLTMLLITFLTMAIFSIHYGRDSTKKKIIFSHVRRHYSNVGFMLKFHSIEHKYQCCGVFGYKDYLEFDDGSTFSSVPVTCCINGNQLVNTTCGYGVLKQNISESFVYSRIRSEGCVKHIMSSYHPYFYFILIESVIVVVILISLLVLISLVGYPAAIGMPDPNKPKKKKSEEKLDELGGVVSDTSDSSEEGAKNEVPEKYSTFSLVSEQQSMIALSEKTFYAP